MTARLTWIQQLSDAAGLDTFAMMALLGLISCVLTFSLFGVLPEDVAQNRVSHPSFVGSGASLVQNPPTDDPLRNRRSNRREKALERFGGNRHTERAVADALAWLAAHQRPDGMWDRRHFDQLCPAHDRCSQTALERLDQDADVGVSALAALAFLGAGYTHEQGLYSENLGRAFSFILSRQDGEGSFSAGSQMQMFNDAIATLAIAEAYAATKDRALLGPLRRAVRHLEHSQQDGGGWDYNDDTSSKRLDMSVSGWVIMALKGAQAAGVSVATETRFCIIDHLDWATEADGRVRHANKGQGTPIDRKTGRPLYRYGSGMTAVGLYVRSVLGFRLDDPIALRQVDLLLDDPPSLARLHGDPMGLHSEYYWYFGTLAMFHVGGKPWKQWNQSLRTPVLESQQRPVDRKGRHGHSFGSWPAFGRGWGRWGRVGSRIYSTAINALTLEIYYRYEPAFQSPQGLIGPIELRRRIAAGSTADHGEVLRLAKRLHADVCEPILLDLLESPLPQVKLDAALALAELDSPMGKTILLDRRAGPSSAPDAALRKRIDAALARLARPPKSYTYGTVTQTRPAPRMFLFETGGQPLYYGRRLSVIRDGQVVATAVVTRRFSAQKAAAARLDDTATTAEQGDVVVSFRGEPEK